MDSIEEIKEKIEQNSEKIDILEKQFIKADFKINNLCEKLESLISTLNKLSFLIGGAFLTGLFTLLIFVIEHKI